MFKSGHVSVMVTDLKQAVRFYVETLGLKLTHQVEGHLAVVEVLGLTISFIYLAGETKFGTREIPEHVHWIGSARFGLSRRTTQIPRCSISTYYGRKGNSTCTL